jgi:hypothetical protein
LLSKFPDGQSSQSSSSLLTKIAIPAFDPRPAVLKDIICLKAPPAHVNTTSGECFVLNILTINEA